MIVFFGAEFTKVYSDFIHGRLSASTKVAKADTQDDKKGQKNSIGK